MFAQPDVPNLHQGIKYSRMSLEIALGNMQQRKDANVFCSQTAARWAHSSAKTNVCRLWYRLYFWRVCALKEEHVSLTACKRQNLHLDYVFLSYSTLSEGVVQDFSAFSLQWKNIYMLEHMRKNNSCIWAIRSCVHALSMKMWFALLPRGLYFNIPMHFTFCLLPSSSLTTWLHYLRAKVRKITFNSEVNKQRVFRTQCSGWNIAVGCRED